MLVNKVANFLKWYDSAADAAQPDLPHAYWKDRESCGSFAIAYPTETLSFYVNTTDGLGANYGTFSDLRLSMVRADTGVVVSASITGLLQHNLTAPNYNLYGTFAIPAGATPGLHYFRIYLNTGGITKLTSGYVLVRTDKTALDNETSYVKFRHDRFFYNIKYAALPGFYQQFRLPLSVIDTQYESENEQYKEVTTGKPRILNSFEERFHKLESYWFDPSMHEALNVMSKHDYLEINGKRYRFKTGLKISTDVRTKINKGEWEVFDEEYASVNRC